LVAQHNVIVVVDAGGIVGEYGHRLSLFLHNLTCIALAKTLLDCKSRHKRCGLQICTSRLTDSLVFDFRMKIAL
jgi:hypothetical protein